MNNEMRQANELAEPDEIITYETREQFIADLKRRGYSREWIKERLEHEDAHMRKALELGYKPKYILGIIEDLGSTRCRPGVRIDEPAPEEDIILMLSAPDKLSIYDENHLRLLKDKQASERAQNAASN